MGGKGIQLVRQTEAGPLPFQMQRAEISYLHTFSAEMYFCTVNVNSRVMICTLSSAHWQQASKLSALRCFELIWTDCAHEYSNYCHHYY